MSTVHKNIVTIFCHYSASKMTKEKKVKWS